MYLKNYWFHVFIHCGQWHSFGVYFQFFKMYWYLFKTPNLMYLFEFSMQCGKKNVNAAITGWSALYVSVRSSRG